MPEILLPRQQCRSNKEPLTERKQRPHTTSVTTGTYTVNWLSLPYELWLTILADYGVTSEDMFNLDRTCKWFKCCWGGGSLTEEAARNVIKKYKRQRFGEFINRIQGKSWKRRLQKLECVELRQPTLAAGSYQNIYLVQDCLLTWGAGKFGQLGNNDQEDNTGQNIVRYVPKEAGRAVQVSAGCGHTGFVTDRGHAFTCGDNRYGQLGQTDFTGRTCKLPQRVHRGLPAGGRCVQIACGSVHTILLMDCGHMYVTGLGDSGQLGLGTERRQKSSLIFTLIPFQYEDYNIVSVTAGIAHNILLTDCGKVFTFGLGSAGQLGHGGTKNLFQPTLVSVVRDKRVVFAAAGACHSILLDSCGKAYTCGKGRGLLGHGNTCMCTVPTCVESLQGVHVVRAAAGVARSIFISSEGVGYWCGQGSGELHDHTALLPTVMHLPEPLHSAAIGNTHIVLQMKSQSIMSIGSNGRLQTGLHSEGGSPIQRYTYIDFNDAIHETRIDADEQND